MTSSSRRDLGGRALGDLVAEVEDDDAVADRGDQGDVVLDHQHRQAALASQPDHDVAEVARLRVAEAGGRFVQQQHGGSGGDGAGDGDQAPAAERQLIRVVVQVTFEAERLDRAPTRPRAPSGAGAGRGRSRTPTDERSSLAANRFSSTVMSSNSSTDWNDRPTP